MAFPRVIHMVEVDLELSCVLDSKTHTNSWVSGSQSKVPRSVALILPGNWLDMQIPRLPLTHY